MKKTNLDNWILKTEALPELTREGLEALQLRRLNEVLSRLRKKGGIYRDYPDHLDTLDQLSTLPFTTPEMLSKHPGQFLLTSQSEVSRVISDTTSGTTGHAKRVFYTPRDTAHTVGFFTAGISEMLHSGEKCLICFPFSGPFGLGDLIAQAVKALGAVPIQAGFGQPWGELCSLVRDTQPETYIGFPVPLLGLARMYGASFPIQRALVSADACPEGVMNALNTSLGNPLYPHYGSRECGLGGAVTCPAFEGMHLRENHILAEIVDEQGAPLPDGAYGELVITTIGLEAMPLIRYRTGDFTRFLPQCPCGGVTRRIDRVSRSSGRLSMENLDSLLFPIPELVDYRASFDGTLLLEARTLSLDAEAHLRQALFQSGLQIPFQLRIELCLPTHAPMYSGKRHIQRSPQFC